jgi:hypothetical protein
MKEAGVKNTIMIILHAETECRRDEAIAQAAKSLMQGGMAEDEAKNWANSTIDEMVRNREIIERDGMLSLPSSIAGR